MADNTIKATGQAEDVIRLDRPFDYEGYQVVRQEFFAHVNEPAVTFNNYKFYGNAACLRKFPATEFVQVLINRERKLLVLRPCGEEDRDAFPWRTQKSKKPKQTTCRLFFAKVFEMMDWNPAHRYRLLGKVVQAAGERLLVFDMTATEIYQRVGKDGEKPKTSRTPLFPAEWKNQFGLPYSQHQKSLRVDLLDGYAIYGLATAKTVEITIDPLRKRIRIHRETLKQLHYPAYVQFLVNPEKFYMAVLGSDQPLRGGTANRLRINPDRLRSAQSTELYSSILLESLSPLLGGMNPAYNYRLSGEVDVENRVAYFSLKQIQTVVRRRYHGSKET